MLALHEQEGRTQAELCQLVQIEQPTMANTLNRMQRDGLISREPWASRADFEAMLADPVGREHMHAITAMAESRPALYEAASVLTIGTHCGPATRAQPGSCGSTG